MGTYGLVDTLIRAVVALAATIFAVPILGRTRRRWTTGGLFALGILLVLAPVTLPYSIAHLGWPKGVWLVLFSRLDALGFALVLFGVFRGLRELREVGEKLQAQNEILKEQASTDALTGLLNRREADSLLQYGAVRARQSSNPLGFVMIDLDHFKSVNDSFGHAAGDAVLAHVGRILKAELRSSDIVARYGGEEFLIVVAEADEHKIVALAESLRSVIADSPAEFEGRTIEQTASFGVSISPAGCEASFKDAIRKADAALYQAKDAGRNRVVLWNEEAGDWAPTAGAKSKLPRLAADRPLKVL
ncbi:MAG: GGDEF domain-containing protein [Phycisphaerae bacterium]|nr:GGDEF domain-containing protein [Phycisphaerae bacterium]